MAKNNAIHESDIEQCKQNAEVINNGAMREYGEREVQHVHSHSLTYEVYEDGARFMSQPSSSQDIDHANHAVTDILVACIACARQMNAWLLQSSYTTQHIGPQCHQIPPIPPHKR